MCIIEGTISIQDILGFDVSIGEGPEVLLDTAVYK